MTSEKALFVKMVMSNWEIQNSRFNKLLDKLSDADLTKEVAPGRNRGVYLLGHLTAVHDTMRVLLGFGEKLYPQLEVVFVTNPDKPDPAAPSTADLRKYWSSVSAMLTEHFAAASPESWFQKHTAVSDADFAKEPHRNKLNILINRTAHLGYHLGQMIFLEKK